MKTLFKIFVLALITVIVGGVFIKLQYNRVIQTPNSESSDNVVITIEQGQAVESIVDELIDAEILRPEWRNYFKIYLRLNDLSSRIQAGTYNIPQNLNIEEIVATLQRAEDQDIWVTIREGLRKDEIADILEKEFANYPTTNFSKTEFLRLTEDNQFISQFGLPSEVRNLEGYIFPDKYAFSRSSDTESVLTKMVNNFVNKVGTSDSYEDIIIASMVEREGRNANDRPMIADIIIRRLNEGWLLQIDATLLYPLKDWSHVIRRSDLERSNEYNTYKYPGLVPTPICNPGLESIEAVRNPKPNSYYYYIHANDGTAHFARTLNEHNANVNKYLR